MFSFGLLVPGTSKAITSIIAIIRVVNLLITIAVAILIISVLIISITTIALVLLLRIIISIVATSIITSMLTMNSVRSLLHRHCALAWSILAPLPKAQQA